MTSEKENQIRALINEYILRGRFRNPEQNAKRDLALEIANILDPIEYKNDFVRANNGDVLTKSFIKLTEENFVGGSLSFFNDNINVSITMPNALEEGDVIEFQVRKVSAEEAKNKFEKCGIKKIRRAKVADKFYFALEDQFAKMA